MKRIAALVFYGYALMFLLSGLLSLLGAHRELEPFFGLDPASLEPLARASLLNQYRFLRAVETGFGLYCLVFRREIFTDARHRLVFLTTLGLIPLSRVASWLIDGTPRPIFGGLLAAEILAWLILLRVTRKET